MQVCRCGAHSSASRARAYTPASVAELFRGCGVAARERPRLLAALPAIRDGQADRRPEPGDNRQDDLDDVEVLGRAEVVRRGRLAQHQPGHRADGGGAHDQSDEAGRDGPSETPPGWSRREPGEEPPDPNEHTADPAR